MLQCFEFFGCYRRFVRIHLHPKNKKMSLLSPKCYSLLYKVRIHILRPRMINPSRGFTAQTQQPVVTTKLDTPEFHALFTPEMKKLVNIFGKHNHTLRIVGGAVRDVLMRRQPADVDFATIATPEQMKTMFRHEKIRIYPNEVGESHGNISVRINDKQDFQITTLRIDEATNGRFAKVEFTTDWYLDACRRDFTINSMYLGFDGTVFDYLNGIEDLENRNVKFIGKPAARIREDYLRILRYFRFYGLVTQDAVNHDSETLRAIEENIDGLSELHGSRLWLELRKILSGNFNFELMKTILQVGTAPHLGLPHDINFKQFDKLHEQNARFSFDAITIITSLLKNESDLSAFNERVRLNKWDRELARFIIHHREAEHQHDPLQPFRELMVLTLENKSSMRHKIEQLLSYRGNVNLLRNFKNWEMPRFPVRNQQLLDLGIDYGKKFESVKKAMLKRWLTSSFALTDHDLLMKFDEILQEIDAHKSKKKLKKIADNV